MLKLIVSGEEFYNDLTESFSTVGDVVLELEHSLISLSKWESEFQKPFLAPGEKTSSEILAYVKLMIITPDYPEDIISKFSQSDFLKINAYIDSKQSATTFRDIQKKGGRPETITSELIYFWMVSYNIPFVCETWHLNRLFSLIRICDVKNSKPKKMSKSQLAQRNRELNAQRKAQLGTTG